MPESTSVMRKPVSDNCNRELEICIYHTELLGLTKSRTMKCIFKVSLMIVFVITRHELIYIYSISLVWTILVPHQSNSIISLVFSFHYTLMCSGEMGLFTWSKCNSCRSLAFKLAHTLNFLLEFISFGN